jgi:hypothetical protein
MSFSGIRLHRATKDRLLELAGQDYTMDDVVNILLENFIEPDDEDEDDGSQLSLFDYDDEDE